MASSSDACLSAGFGGDWAFDPSEPTAAADDDWLDGTAPRLCNMRARCSGLPDDVSPGGLARIALLRLSVTALFAPPDGPARSA